MSVAIESFLTRAEEKLDGLAKSLVEKIDDAAVQAHLGLMELNDQWQVNQADLLRSASRARAAGERLKGEIDRTRVQAHLAKSDGVDTLANLKGRLRRIEDRVAYLKVSLAHESHAVLDHVSGACRNLSGQLDS